MDNVSVDRKWDYRYLALAKLVSTWSKDPSTKVGSVLIGLDGNPLSFGFNGFPRGVHDTVDRYNNRDIKLQMIIHAERNSILFADRDAMKGSTLYTYPFMPCSVCAGLVIQAGIIRVVAPINNVPRWAENLNLSKTMFSESGVVFDLVEDFE